MRTYCPGPIAVLILLALAWDATAGDDGTVAVLSEAQLGSAWVPKESPLEHFEVSGRSMMQYGCVNVGFIIESDGAIEAPARLLAYRGEVPFKPWDKVPTLMANVSLKSMSEYAPAPGATPEATYTSLAVPFFHKKLSKSLSDEERSRLASALRRACLIDALAERLTRADKEAEQLDPLPTLDVLLER